MTQRARSGRSTRASAAKLRTVAKAKEPKGQNTDGMNGGNQFSIVAVDRFIQATRDSGYKSTSSAVAELVDNAIQADATRIRITVCHATDGETGAVELLVQDKRHRHGSVHSKDGASLRWHHSLQRPHGTGPLRNGAS